MDRFWVLLRLELQRRLRDPVSMAVWFAIPLLLAGLLAAAFGPKGTRALPKVKMVVVDHDGGVVAMLFSSALHSGRLGTLLDVEQVDEQEGRRIMDRGGAALMVSIPKGFSAAFMRDKPVTIRVFRNPQETILPKIGRDVIVFLADAGAELRAVLAPLTKGLVDLGGTTKPALTDVTALSARIWAVVNQPVAAKLVNMESLEVTAHHPEPGHADGSEVIRWFAPGIVAMALLFLCIGQSQELQEDFVSGRLARAWTFPTHPWIVLGAKATALIVTVIAIAAALVLGLAGVFGWHAGNAVLLLVHTGAVAAAFSGLALLLRSLTRNTEAGGAAASGVMVGLGFLGGCFMPVFVLPPLVRHVASIIPTGWAVEGYLILAGVQSPGSPGWIWPRIGGLLVTAAISFGLAAWLMGKKVDPR